MPGAAARVRRSQRESAGPSSAGKKGCLLQPFVRIYSKAVPSENCFYQKLEYRRKISDGGGQPGGLAVLGWWIADFRLPIENYRPSLDVSAFAARMHVDQSEGRSLARLTGLDGHGMLVILGADLQLSD